MFFVFVLGCMSLRDRDLSTLLEVDRAGRTRGESYYYFKGDS